MEEADLQRKKRIAFTKEDDSEMLRLVVSENPFKNLNRWKMIADELKEKRRKRFTPKNVRERVGHLIVLFRDKKVMQREVSGKGYYSELHRRLQEASDLKREASYDQNLRKMRKLQGEVVRENAAVTYDHQEAVRENAAVTYDHQYTTVVKAEKQIVENDGSLPMFRLADIMDCTTDPLIIHPTIGEQQLTAVRDATNNPAQTPSSLPTMSTTAGNSATLSSSVPTGTPNKPSPDTSKKTVLQIVWSKLKDEEAYKTELLAVERLKAENEKRKLEVRERKNKFEYEIKCKKIELEETQMNMLKEHMDQTSRFQEKMLDFLDTLVKKGQ